MLGAARAFKNRFQVEENRTAWLGTNYGRNDPSSPTFTTTYSYDALDNPVGVSQSGQTRAFAYDSLKRLVHAKNPESGNLDYQCDQSGNLLTRIDANGSATNFKRPDGSSGWDGLNRLTSKLYTPGAGVSSTSPVS